MIVDTCMHLSSHDVVRYPPVYLQPDGASRLPYWVDRPHGDPSGPDPAKDASPEHLRRCMLATPVPVDRAVNFCNGWYGWDNHLAIDLLREGRDSWLACGVLLDPADPTSPAALKELVGAGACGLRIQPIVTGRPLDDPSETPLWQAAAELGIAIDVNLPQQEYSQVARRAEQFPTVPIILDHCGWLIGRDPDGLTVDAVCDLARYANVYAKITFMHAASREPYPHRDTHHLVHQLIAAFGAERWWTRPLADDSSRLARSHTMIAVLLACGARISPGPISHSLATRTPRPSRYSGSTWGCRRRTGAG